MALGADEGGVWALLQAVACRFLTGLVGAVLCVGPARSFLTTVYLYLIVY